MGVREPGNGSPLRLLCFPDLGLSTSPTALFVLETCDRHSLPGIQSLVAKPSSVPRLAEILALCRHLVVDDAQCSAVQPPACWHRVAGTGQH